MTPQWLLLLVSSYVALRFVSRVMAARRAAAAVRRVQNTKRIRRDADMAVLDDKMHDTEAERANGVQEEVVQQSATALVEKMAAGANRNSDAHATPRAAHRSRAAAGSCPCDRGAQRTFALCSWFRSRYCHAAGTYSARLVLHSLLARLVAAQAQFNVLSESNFAQALDDADKADQQSEQHTTRVLAFASGHALHEATA